MTKRLHLQFKYLLPLKGKTMKYVLFLLMLAGHLSAQTKDPEGMCPEIQSGDTIYHSVCEMLVPEFPGGVQKIYEYLSKNIKYPTLAKELSISAKVFVEFIIRKDGKISRVRFKKAASVKAPDEKDQKQYDLACQQINDEAIRVVSAMPKWSPGVRNGEPVHVNYIIPISFIAK